MSSWSRASVRTVIDPEALIVATVALGDERLHDESIDWAIDHASLLMRGRIRRLAEGMPQHAAVDRWIATVGLHSDQVAWKSPPGTEIDGFERSGASASYRTTGAGAVPAAALRMRSLVGATARSEIIRVMHVVVAGRAASLGRAEVALDARVAVSQSNAALDELVAAGFLNASGPTRGRRFAPSHVAADALSTALWAPWRAYAYAPWGVVPALVAHLAAFAELRVSTQPRTAAIGAAAQLDALRPLVQVIDPDLAGFEPRGTTIEALAAIVDWSDTVARRLHEVMAHGSVDEPAATRAPVATDNPWGNRPFG